MKTHDKGVTLLEILLVLAIVSSAFGIYINYFLRNAETSRINVTLLQVQEIQNAALVYYLENEKWPGTECTLTTLNPTTTATAGVFIGPYIKQQAMFTPWGAAAGTGYYQYYFCSKNATDTGAMTVGSITAATLLGSVPKNAFVVVTEIGSTTARQAIGKQLAGRLPSAAFISPYLFSWVFVPPQALNKVKGAKFAGLYYHGGCVPKPICPSASTGGIDTTAQLFLVPISVSGANDNSPSTNVYPISSFTAYTSAATAAASPAACTTSSTVAGTPTCSGGNSTGQYWRACAQVITERGDLQSTRTDASAFWGKDVTIAAFTRCAPNNEKSGSPITIFGD